MDNSKRADVHSRRMGRGVLGIAIVVSCIGLFSQAVRADDDHGDRDGNRGRGRYDHHDRGRGHEEHRRYRVYAPAPIYYPRQESPGISLFIPLWDR